MIGRFEGQVAIVTGAASGIGETIAELLQREGATVVGCDRSRPSGVLESGPIQYRVVDVSSQVAVRALVEETVQQWGRLDVVVCCAGVRSNVALEDLDDAEWDRVHAVNLKGTFYTVQAATAAMAAQRRGRIVTVASLAGKVGGTVAGVAYSTSKAGIINLTRAAAKAMARYDVTVNCVAPGTIDTPFIGDYDDERRESLRSLIPLGRLGSAADVAQAIAFLASDDASWITGTCLDVNGGQAMD